MPLPFRCIGSFSKERTHAYRVLWRHGLKDWHVEVESVPPYKGRCCHQNKTISLDTSHVLRGPWRDVRKTILHEIAHALSLPWVKPHGQMWQMYARSLGVSESDIAWHEKVDRREARRR